MLKALTICVLLSCIGYTGARAQEVPDTPWNRLIAEALKRGNKYTTTCDETGCVTQLRFRTGKTGWTAYRKADEQGHETLILCKNKECARVQ